MQYSQSIFRITAQEDFVRDVLVAGLAELGYETFVDKLTEQHRDDPSIKYHIVKIKAYAIWHDIQIF